MKIKLKTNQYRSVHIHNNILSLKLNTLIEGGCQTKIHRNFNLITLRKNLRDMSFVQYEECRREVEEKYLFTTFLYTKGTLNI